MEKIYIVILHYKDDDLLMIKDCLFSLFKKEDTSILKSLKIVLVNNNSNILSEKDFEMKNLIVINNRKNLGFAAGANVGISYSLKHKADFILLLNDDTLIKKPFIKKLIKLLKEDEKYGIAGPAIAFEREGKLVFDLGGDINKWTGKTTHIEVTSINNNSPHKATFITGAAMLIKREVFEKIGLMDESFFLDYDDADFCTRAKKAGFETIVDPSVSIYHHLSKTIGKMTLFGMYHRTRSAIIFGNKYFSAFPKNIVNKSFIIFQTCLFFLKYLFRVFSLCYNLITR